MSIRRGGCPAQILGDMLPIDTNRGPRRFRRGAACLPRRFLAGCALFLCYSPAIPL